MSSLTVPVDDEVAQLLLNEEQENSGLGSTQGLTNERIQNTTNYEVALKETGFGKFNILLLLLCGWAQISDSAEILSVSFLLPVASFGETLTDQEKGILNSVVFVGMMIGGYVWGALADIRGRKGILVYSLATNAFFGLASSLAQSYWLFLLCRFFSGIGVGGSIPVVFSYFGEFQQTRHRGTMISALSTCWMVGNIFTAGLAWLIIPSNIGYVSPDNKFSYQSWRVFIAVCVLPATTSAISFIFLPESPKYLLEIGEEEKALSILRMIYKLNRKRGSPEEYPIKHIISSSKAEHKVRGDPRKGLAFHQVLRSTMQLFHGPLLRVTLAILVIVFCLSFGYYGLWMWFPQIFAQVEYGNGTACSSNNVKIPSNGTSSAVYKDAFLTALSNLPGNIITILFMDILGRRFLMASSLLLSGISVFFIWFVSTRTQVLITSLCFGGTSVITWNTLNVLGVELFPTHLRSTALGVQSVLNRVGAITGNLMFGILINVHCAIPLLSVALLLSIAGFTTLTLPNNSKVALQ